MSKNYSAHLPGVPGRVSTGDTIDETLLNIKEAFKFHLEGLAEEKFSLPEPASPETHLKNGDIVLEDDVIIAYMHVCCLKNLWLNVLTTGFQNLIFLNHFECPVFA